MAVNYLLAITFHELGHFFCAKSLGYKLSKFSLSPYGVALSYYQQNLQIKDEIKIAIAGPVLNLVTAFLILGVWWLVPEIYFFTDSFVSISCSLAFLNLLPAYPLDGGRIFMCTTSLFLKSKTAKNFTLAFNTIFALLFFALFVVFCFINFNPSYLLFSVFLVVGCMDIKQNSIYEKTSVFNKEYKNFEKTNILSVTADVCLKELLDKISSNKTHIFCLVLNNGKIINISEKIIIKLSLNYPLNTKLKEIFKN